MVTRDGARKKAVYRMDRSDNQVPSHEPSPLVRKKEPFTTVVIIPAIEGSSDYAGIAIPYYPLFGTLSLKHINDEQITEYRSIQSTGISIPL